MPMKCIDQMPRPMAKPPPSRHHQAAPLPGAVTVRPAAEDVAYYMSQQAGQVAAVQAQQVNAQLATQAASLISGAASR